MSTVGYDGQSLTIGSRRVWLVSGAVHYSRVPAGLWRSRVQAAKQAGLNCIDCYVMWNLHEPRPGEFDFSGDLGLRRFVETVVEEGLYCVLKPGPYVGLGWDLGGLPAWLLRTEGMRLREGYGPYLEACARYLGAVLEQVKGLQVPEIPYKESNDVDPGGGPRGVVMMQVENQWCCGHEREAKVYLGELTRYLREHGCVVPICETSNLWSPVEGTIACWRGEAGLAGILRQLRVVQGQCPRMVVESSCSRGNRWGQAQEVGEEPGAYVSQLASILAVGGQYSIEHFHGGTYFGFWGGRRVGGQGGYATTGYGGDAPLLEAGGRGEKYAQVKSISVFASQFGHVFAHLEGGYQPACVDPMGGGGVSVIHQRGAQGDVVFLFKDPKARSGGGSETVALLGPSGVHLTVELGGDTVAWVTMGVQLSGVASLTYTNLRPWAFVGRRMLVLFGPAGTEGVVCVNEAALTVKVPTGAKPVVEQHEGLTVVVLNRQQMEGAYVGSDRLVLGVDGLDETGRPFRIGGGGARAVVVGVDGKTETVKARESGPPAAEPALLGWQRSDADRFVGGDDGVYMPIDGPRGLEALESDRGYGWYRLRGPRGGKTLVMGVDCGDRLHFYAGGRLVQVVGEGPGAVSWPVQLAVGGEMVVLADNLGRWSEGWSMGEKKGMGGPLYAVEPVRLGRPKMVETQTPDLFKLRGFLPFAHRGERGVCDGVVWLVRVSNQNPLIVEIAGLEGRAAMVVNGQLVGAYDEEQSGGATRWVLEVGAHLKKGANEIQWVWMGGKEADGGARSREKALVGRLTRCFKVYRAKEVLTAKCQWAFGRWRVPGADEFSALTGRSSGGLSGGPCWYRATFRVAQAETPLWLEPGGLTKGQVYLNGRNVGRYFVATHRGQKVGPQDRYYLPQSWIKRDEPNELMIFDEHGASPLKCRLVYDWKGSQR